MIRAGYRNCVADTPRRGRLEPVANALADHRRVSGPVAASRGWRLSCDVTVASGGDSSAHHANKVASSDFPRGGHVLNSRGRGRTAIWRPALSHQIINTSTTTMRYLALSTLVDVEACDYPDSRKILTASGQPGGHAITSCFRIGS